jgi:hypothetical protein
MKFGFRIPNLNKRIAARTSVKRIIRHNLGFKAPRGYGWITNPKKALYNRVYNRTTTGCMVVFGWLLGLPFLLFLIGSFFLSCTDSQHSDENGATYVQPSIDKRGRFKKGHVRMPSSTKKDAIKNRNRSRYYYETRGKYRRKKKKD